MTQMIAQMLDSMNTMVESRKNKPHHWDVSSEVYGTLRKLAGRYGVIADPTGNVRVLFGLPVVIQPSWTSGWVLVSEHAAIRSNRL